MRVKQCKQQLAEALDCHPRRAAGRGAKVQFGTSPSVRATAAAAITQRQRRQYSEQHQQWQHKRET